MDTKEKIEIMQAHEDGKIIEIFTRDYKWHKIDYPDWNWTDFDYRIKVSPREVYITIDYTNCNPYMVHTDLKDAKYNKEYYSAQELVKFVEVLDGLE